MNDSRRSTQADAQLERSKAQFGANAASYTTSRPHAKGASLKRLAELTMPQPDWHVLDIATGGGHMAFELAPYVTGVTATDVTPEMLKAAAGVATERALSNVSFEIADAHALPFAGATFDAVTCRIAPHHFSDPATFVTESARVLKPGGTFGLVDNIAPEDPEAAIWCDDFERRRDLSHLRCLPMTEWHGLIAAAGLSLTHSETMLKEMPFAPWARNMSVPADVSEQLLADLRDAPEGARAWLRPTVTDDAETSLFHLTEGIYVASKPQ